jgi:hypothetical protein
MTAPSPALYTVQTWADNDSRYPASAARIAHLEAGVVANNYATRLMGDNIYNVRDTAFAGGAVGDGAADDTAAFTAAANALIANGGGTLYIPLGTYKVTTLPTFTTTTGIPLPYAVVGDGRAVSKIMHYGVGLASSLTANCPGFDAAAAPSGSAVWRGFTINGANSSGGAVGIAWGDISYPTFFDIRLEAFPQYGFYFNSPYGWTEGIRMDQCAVSGNGTAGIAYGVGLGQPVGTVTTTIASGAVFTSIAVTGGTTRALFSGQQFVLYPGTGTSVQTLTTSASVSVGATSIPVTSTTASQAYTSGTAGAFAGSYGSFDYCHIMPSWISAPANSDGILSEVPMGLNQKIDRLGGTVRLTGNFAKATTNTGYFLHTKGNDAWSHIEWGVNCETGGTGNPHGGIKTENGTSGIGGWGHFVLYFFGASSLAGSRTQLTMIGVVALRGITDSVSDTSGAFPHTLLPTGTQSQIFSSVAPTTTDYPTTAPASGVSWQNLSGANVWVDVGLTFTTAGTYGARVHNFSGLGPPDIMLTADAPSGASRTVQTRFLHYAGSWARVDWTGTATAGVKVVRYAAG